MLFAQSLMNSSASVEPTPGEETSHLPQADELPESEIRELSFHQHVQLSFPSLIDAVGKLADSNPEIAHKIVDDIIQQGTHRQHLEEVVVRGDNLRSTIAQVLAWLFAMTALIGSIWLIRSEQPTAGIVLIILALAPLVGANVVGRRAALRERVRKAQLARQPTMDKD